MQTDNSNEPRVNHKIKSYQVMLIDETGQKIGVKNTNEALSLAQERGFDLVEINGKAFPPVCRLMDYGKYKYLQKKKKAEIAKGSKVIKTKELQLHPNTDEHDINTIINKTLAFLKEGDKVKLVVKFIGREIMHNHLGREKLDLITKQIIAANEGTIEVAPILEGKNLFVVLSPSKQQ